MSLSPKQLGALHSTRRRLEELTGGVFDRHAYNAFLIEHGGLKGLPASSKDLTQAGFERVMAAMEATLSRFVPNASTHFRQVDERRRAGLLSERQEREIRELHAELAACDTSYPLDGIVRRLSNRRVDQVEHLRPVEASMVIEMLKATIARQTPRPVG